VISTGLEEWTWRSHAVLAGELGPDGAIVRANPALERFGAESVFAIVPAPQHRALARRLEAAGDEWRAATFALASDPGRTATDWRVWLRRAGEGVLLVAEPEVGEQQRLVERVLELNDELVDAHRELVKQRAAAEAAATRVRHLEAIAAAGLAGLDLDVVLADVLRVIAGAVGAEWATVLLRDARGELAPRATIATDGPVPAELSLAVDVAADARPRIVRDGPSVVAAPLVLLGEVTGVLQLGTARPDAFGVDDLRLLLPAAERAALAIWRAELHEREHRIAETLQRALMPDRLPAVPGARLSAHFEPAAGVEVGGDWYDALWLESGELALAIGDVAGKGVSAAALMGELRGGLRACALQGGGPDEMLARLDLLAQRAERMVTVLIVLFDPSTGALRYAGAGHLPPLLVGADSRFLREGASTPLMAFVPGRGAGSAVLEPGERLVLYTDGLVERRDEPIDTSLERLRAAARANAAPEALVAAMRPPEGMLRDDIAVLCLERER
jgi:phosphoserine phosphatase RsbU/P